MHNYNIQSRSALAKDCTGILFSAWHHPPAGDVTQDVRVSAQSKNPKCCFIRDSVHDGVFGDICCLIHDLVLSLLKASGLDCSPALDLLAVQNRSLCFYIVPELPRPGDSAVTT